MSDWPKIKARQTNKVSPWMDIIARKVEFAPGAASEIYHAVGQQDYIAIVALTPDGKIPIVRQYRPALERFTWELPAGIVEKGEDRRRLLPARIAGGNRVSRQIGASAGNIRALHRASVEPHPFLFRGGRAER